MNKTIRTLYLTYDGICGNLGESQILSYLIGLSKKDHQIYLISFEKKDEWEKKGEKIKKIIKGTTIQWFPLFYHKKPFFFSTLYDVTVGLLLAIYLIIRNKISFIHFRSYVPGATALILKLLFPSLKVIFDLRGFWPEERINIGICRLTIPKISFSINFLKESFKYFLYHFFKLGEKLFFHFFDGFVVLTNKGKKILKSRKEISPHKPIFTIPTTVNLDNISFYQNKKEFLKDYPQYLFLKDKFIVIYTGSLGKRYNLDEMIRTFQYLKKEKRNALFLCLTPQQEIFQTKMESLNFKNKIDYYCDYINDPRLLFHFYKISDLGIAFYSPQKDITRFSMYGTSPTKINEYLLNNLSVLTYPAYVGDLEELAELTGKIFFWNPDSPFIPQKLWKSLSQKTPLDKLYFLKLDWAIEKYHQLYLILSNKF